MNRKFLETYIANNINLLNEDRKKAITQELYLINSKCMEDIEYNNTKSLKLDTSFISIEMLEFIHDRINEYLNNENF